MHTLRCCGLFCVAGIVCVVLTISVSGQETLYDLSGAVLKTDATPVEGAVVILYPGGYADTTGTDGCFAIPSIPAGDYSLTISAPQLGLEDVRRRVNVTSGVMHRLEIRMRERTYHVDEIVVLSGHERPVGLEQTSSSFVTVVERSQFENDATTVADVIRATPGATITTMGGLGDYTEVSLRGAYANQVQVYIDGMLLNEAVGGAVNLGTIPLTNVESVEVWRSGAPALYGGDAAGGVINICTRDPRIERKTFSLAYGSFNTLTAGTVLSIPRGMSRYLMTLDYASSNNDFEYRSDNGTMYNLEDDYRARRANDEYRAANVLGKYSRLYGNGMFLELSEHLMSNRKNLPGKDNLRISHASLETTKNLVQVKMTVNSFPGDFLEFQPVLHHIYTHERYRDLDGSVGWGFQDNVYRTNALSFMAPLTVHAGNHATVSVTPTAKFESYDPDYKLQATAPLSCVREQAALVVDSSAQSPGGRLALTANIRRDRYHSTYHGEPSPQNRETPRARFDYFTNATIGINLKVLKYLAIKGNYADVSRVPGFYELFGDRGGTLSNPLLKPEHTVRRDAGARAWVDWIDGNMSGIAECARFENTYRDLIQWYTNDAGFVAAENVGKSYVRGTEIVWNISALKRFTIKGNWTFQESKITEELRKYYRDKQLPNRPKNYGSVKVGCTVGRFVPFWSLDRKSSYFLDRANQPHKRYPGRSLHDIGVSFPFMGGRSSCTVLVRNVSDVHTFDTIGMPKPGRSYMVTFVHTL